MRIIEAFPHWLDKLIDKAYFIITDRIRALKPFCAICGKNRGKYYWGWVTTLGAAYTECQECYDSWDN